MENAEHADTAAQPSGLILFCDSCEKQLEAPGALVYSPMTASATENCRKYHICVLCWEILEALIAAGLTPSGK